MSRSILGSSGEAKCVLSIPGVFRIVLFSISVDKLLSLPVIVLANPMEWCSISRMGLRALANNDCYPTPSSMNILLSMGNKSREVLKKKYF
jgi:hypothetical protein